MKKIIHILVVLLVTASTQAQLYVGANSSVYLSNGSTVTVSGADVTLNSPLSGAGTGALLLSGTAQQKLNCNGNAVWGLQVNNTSGAVINSNLTVQGALTLTNGPLYLNGYTLTANGAITSATGTVAGSAASSLIVGGSGTINFLQTGTGNILNNLTMASQAGALSLGNTLNVAGVFTLAGGQLNTGGNLTLTSTAKGTAVVAPVTGGTITGNVTVQRYIPAHRAWRFLTAPLSNTGSIYTNWQNNGVVTDSTGALIFAPGGGGGLTAGGHTASIERYDPIANNWVNLTNTNSNLLSGTSSSAANLGYGLFVTGPYGSVNIASGSAATTLSAAGALQTGQQQFTYSGLQAGAYILVGNPYASPVGFTQVGATGALSGNIANTMWAWDAQRSGTSYGGYVTFSWDPVSSSYDQDIDPSQTKQTTTIQSGQAFFVQAVNNGAATVTFNETDKADASANTVGVLGLTPTPAEQVRVTLSRKIGDTLTAVDGVLAKFADGYSKGVSDDVAKQFDYDENLSLQIDTNYLAIERRPVPEVGDTLFLNTYALKKNTSYSFTVAPQNLQGGGVQAWLVDNYLTKKTQLSLADSTTVAFSTNGAVASLSETRFNIAFGPNGTLATTQVGLKAWAAGSATQLQWTATTEQGIKQYQLERSGNAQSFVALSAAVARNSGQPETYTRTDAQPLEGNNYYRIKVYNRDGTTTYSNTVLVKIAPGTAAFSVYPNPVQRGRQITTLFNKMPAGKYTLHVYGNNGKLLMTKTIQHDGVTATQAITLPAGLAVSSYQLVLLDGNGKQWNVQLAVE